MIATCGSMVQNGKFAAGILDFVKALKSVDLPTFGSPTSPALIVIMSLFYKLFFRFNIIYDLSLTYCLKLTRG